MMISNFRLDYCLFLSGAWECCQSGITLNQLQVLKFPGPPHHTEPCCKSWQGLVSSCLLLLWGYSHAKSLFKVKVVCERPIHLVDPRIYLLFFVNPVRPPKQLHFRTVSSAFGVHLYANLTFLCFLLHASPAIYLCLVSSWIPLRKI